MKKEDKEDVVVYSEYAKGLVTGLITALLVMLVLGLGWAEIYNEKWRKEAISQNCGEYNSKTGEFQWINSTEKE